MGKTSGEPLQNYGRKSLNYDRTSSAWTEFRETTARAILRFANLLAWASLETIGLACWVSPRMSESVRPHDDRLTPEEEARLHGC